nr:immunoglobulin heavy chain junction region [Macaca mulatta]MOX61151.1 immunoglobulin heavy chain junction region [Macaca mulatta]MOX61243.1 immunoglobulin heavy chain junction region [Macaca mulatta]MOX61461.1 immunoglobulin heavy chain junction region [Macaca mulatta]MOX62494.1 immunoglobulin heavy chain junction region [Macaca mulatta]
CARDAGTGTPFDYW